MNDHHSMATLARRNSLTHAIADGIPAEQSTAIVYLIEQMIADTTKAELTKAIDFIESLPEPVEEPEPMDIHTRSMLTCLKVALARGAPPTKETVAEILEKAVRFVNNASPQPITKDTPNGVLVNCHRTSWCEALRFNGPESLWEYSDSGGFLSPQPTHYLPMPPAPRGEV